MPKLFDTSSTVRFAERLSCIQKEFSNPLETDIELSEESTDIQSVYEIKLKNPTKDVKYVVVREDITEGQRVENFFILSEDCGGDYFPLYQGYCIGNKKICVISNPFEEQNPLLGGCDAIRSLKLKVTAARDKVNIKSIEVY